ncbi:hypothetical protein D1007_56116 [Hordeum vulgare]|nr:hypothetical protein D1007_56116 [Hordeum vulgare]
MEEVDKRRKENSDQEKKWGHVLSTRPTTRQHGNIKIMEKATAYLQKKNLGIPASFQGKYFATNDAQLLVDQIARVDICVGDSNEEQREIIQDLILRESLRCLEFADSNPEIVLPDNLYTPTHKNEKGSPCGEGMVQTRSDGVANSGSSCPT